MTQQDDRQFIRSIVVYCVLSAFVFAAIFLSNPQIDIWISGLVFNHPEGFLFRQYVWIYNLRQGIINAYIVWYVAIILYAVYEIFMNKGKRLRANGLLPLKGLYLVFTSLIGPLAVANGVFKNNWGRARPRDVGEFNGTLEFSPPLVMSDQCVSNCSFVSGETSSMVMIFASLAFIWPAKRKLMIILMFVMGAFSGVMRIGPGAHFFSDVIFASIFMLLIAALVYWVMFVWKVRKPVQ